jgi:hypothetical protein
VHLDAGDDSGKTRGLLAMLGCDWEIGTKGVPLQVGQRWPVERTNSWHTRGFGKLQVCTERRARVIETFSALANAIIITRNLIHEAWTRYRWKGSGSRRAGRRRAEKRENPRLTGGFAQWLRPASIR